MKTLGRVGAVLVAVLSLLMLALAPLGPPASAKQAPVLTVTVARTDASYPRLVTLNGDTTSFSFTVTTTEPTTVTVSASGPGLSATPPAPRAISSAEPFHVSVTATTPGTHALTVTFSAPSAAPVVVNLPYVIAEGSPLPPSTGSLAGRSYGWMGSAEFVESSSRVTTMLSFVNATYAYVGLPPAGRPKCKKAGKGCEPYSYDAATGVVQVGADIVGKVLGEGLATEGLIYPDEEDGELFSAYTATDPLTFAPRHSRMAGVWHFQSDLYPDGIWAQSLTLRKDGTYTLYYQYDLPSKHRSYTGTYAITGKGHIVFRSKGKVVENGTLALVGAKVGKPRANKLGLWLVLSGPKGKRGDGNLLDPVKK